MKPKLPFIIFTPLEGHALQCGDNAKKNYCFGRILKFLLTGFTIIALICNLNVGAFAQELAPNPTETKTETAGAIAETPPTAAETSSTAAETSSTTEEKAKSAAETPPPAEEKAKSANVTLIFKDADIRTVLHTLSYKSGVNIVAAEDVKGKVSIRLVDVPWETAFEVILKNQGLTHEKVGNIIRVITLEAVSEEELQNEVFILNYSKAKDVAAAIKDTLTERGKIKYDERTNTLIVTDIPVNLYKVKEVIARLDKRTPQVAIEARLIETTLDKDDKLGIDWGLKVTASGSARPTTLPFERERIPFSRSRGDGTELERFGHYLPVGSSGFPSTTMPVFPYVAATSFTFGTLNFTDFSAVLELLKSRTDTKIISNPTVTTLNNQPARVTVATVYNIPTYERNETTGGMDVTGYTEKELGVILTVVPHVNEAGDIVIDLKPEVSSWVAWDEFGSGTNLIKAPRFTTRTAETQVMVKDGQTIAIGGLTKETTSKYIKKVPILGDIPLLGELFKKTEDGIDTVDLLIFVTVRLIKEDHDDLTLMKETEKKAIHATEDVKF